MSTLGFDKYVEPLKVYLNKYRESVRGDKPYKDPVPGGSRPLVFPDGLMEGAEDME